MYQYCASCGAKLRTEDAFNTPDCPACGAVLETTREKPDIDE